jgi:hypothetical protein
VAGIVNDSCTRAEGRVMVGAAILLGDLRHSERSEESGRHLYSTKILRCAQNDRVPRSVATPGNHPRLPVRKWRMRRYGNDWFTNSIARCRPAASHEK